MNLVNSISIEVKHIVWTIIAWNDKFTVSSEFGHCISKLNLFIMSSNSFLSGCILAFRSTFNNLCLRIVPCCFYSSVGWFSNDHSFSICSSYPCFFMCRGFHHCVCGYGISLELSQMFDIIGIDHLNLLMLLSCNSLHLQVSFELNLHFKFINFCNI